MMLFNLGAVLFLLAQTVTGQEIVGLTLVSSPEGSFIRQIQNGSTIDLAVDTPPFSIRAEVVGETSMVEFDTNDGSIVLFDKEYPFFMAGDSDGSPVPASTLEALGTHSLRVKTSSTEEFVEFSVIDSAETLSTSSTGSPTLAPTVQSFDVDPYNHSPFGALTGELRQWHKITLGFDGATASESDSIDNPFTNYRLDVTFAHALTGKEYKVPGYFAADGNSANTGASEGKVWLCHFAPSEVGNWTWAASFIEGPDVVFTNDGTSASFFDGAVGSFEVQSSNKLGRDLRGKGLLRYVDERYLQFAGNGEYFLKAGAASPENILAYKDFDSAANTAGYVKSWDAHTSDYIIEDPTWAGGRGTGLIGAINYLSRLGMNAFGIHTLTVCEECSDESEFVFPFVQQGAFLQYDVSKLAQWEIVLEHADVVGMHVQVRTQKQINDQLLNEGSLGLERTLYYRELIARFGHHLALTWNLGNENTNDSEERMSFSDFFEANDPYRHPVVLHAFSAGIASTYEPLLNYSAFDGASLQSRPESAFSETLQWVSKSSDTGKDWIVSIDEQNPNSRGVVPDEIDPSHDVIRKNFLWAGFMAGGAGIEYFFGYNYKESDSTCEDYRSREAMWDQSRYALEFFSMDFLPLEQMSSENERIDVGNWVLADSSNSTYVAYLPNGGSANLDLKDRADGKAYTVRWYNPRQGGVLQMGSVTTILPGSIVSVGSPPGQVDLDWAVVVTLCSDCVNRTMNDPLNNQ